MNGQQAPVVEVDHVTFWYRPGVDPEPVLDDVSLTVYPDDFLGLIGPNGGGKTTLLKIILGLIRPQKGRVRVFGSDPCRVRHLVGYVPQAAQVQTHLPLRVVDVVRMGRLHQSRWGPFYSQADRLAAEKALELVNLHSLAQAPVANLSGGQRQRMLIARALAADAKLLLLDEPTANIDAPSEQNLTDLLHELNRTIPIILVSHDVAFVTTHMRRVACLNRRLSVHRTDELSVEHLQSVYGLKQCSIVHNPSCSLFDAGCQQGCRILGQTARH